LQVIFNGNHSILERRIVQTQEDLTAFAKPLKNAPSPAPPRLGEGSIVPKWGLVTAADGLRVRRGWPRLHAIR